jgi:hypothetical protein
MVFAPDIMKCQIHQKQKTRYQEQQNFDMLMHCTNMEIISHANNQYQQSNQNPEMFLKRNRRLKI